MEKAFVLIDNKEYLIFYEIKFGSNHLQFFVELKDKELIQDTAEKFDFFVNKDDKEIHQPKISIIDPVKMIAITKAIVEQYTASNNP